MSIAKKLSKKQPKYGLKIDEIKKEDYIFGGFTKVPFEEINPSGDWSAFLPLREEQNLNGIESYACVSFTILNAIEILIKKKYGEDRNYSDRFLAAISGTKDGGNSPKQVCEFLRKLGVVPQELWPFDSSVTSFEKFYEPLPPKLYELAREFNAEWDFKYEIVPSDNEAILKTLKCSPLGLSVSAWFQKGDKYYKPANMTDNHFTTLISAVSGDYKRIFDSYDSFIKDYDWDTKHSIIQRYWIAKKKLNLTFWQKVIEWFKAWYNL